MPERQIAVLFVCIHNAGRSQMAAAFATVLGSARAGVTLRAQSAGSAPGSALNPVVVAAMRECGLDISQETPKGLTDAVVSAADLVVTMGCGDACPILSGKRYLDWELDDPAGQPIEVVRAVRDDIRARIASLLSEMDSTGPV